jgi:hypothetical protein
MKTLELMIRMNPKKFLAAGLALAGFSLASNAPAATELLIGGGNASQTLLYDRVTNLLAAGFTLKSTSTSPPIRTYIGSITNLPALGQVTIDFSLLGGAQGLTDLAEQNTETTAYGSNVVPALVVSSASPTASAVNPGVLTGTTTLAVPYAYVINAAESPNLAANVTNLTQRQANFLEASAGTFPSAVLGGSITTDTVYLVPRNTASAVRTEIDANIYFTKSISAWTTNGAPGQPPIPDPNGGQSSGSAVRALLALIPESIGTVAFSDISTETPLNFEGVAPSIGNVENGSYPLWYYEQWFQAESPQTPLSANQVTLINTLLSSYTNSTYQQSNPNFVGFYVPLTGLTNFSRPSDGGPIESLQY